MIRLVFAILLVMVGFVADPARAQVDSLYGPSGKDSWDWWFAQSGGRIYGFYLQCPSDAPERHGDPHIGLAWTDDLVRWTEVGEVLGPSPPGTWNDTSLATGSVYWHGSEWRMLFTGHTNTGSFGLGVASSSDLLAWNKVGPIQRLPSPFIIPDTPYWRDKGYVPGEERQIIIVGDPYVYPEPVDGWYYLVANAFMWLEESERGGCLLMMRSMDGYVWEDVGLVAAPREFNRMEVPQLWRHGDDWYLFFGGAREFPLYRANLVYRSDSMFGPFEPTSQPELRLPAGQPGFYIGKIFQDPIGREVLMACTRNKISRPYGVTYGADGSLTTFMFPPAGRELEPSPAATSLRVSPNPVRGRAAIWLALRRESLVTLRVYDAAGRVVATPAHRLLPAGQHSFTWDARACPPGVYHVRATGSGIGSLRARVTRVR